MNRKDKKVIKVLILTVAGLIVAGLFIPITVSAPSDTRTIVDHTTQTYTAPSCFNDAEMTNFLQETTYGHALSLNYEAESSCSTDFFTESGVPLFFAMLQLFGVGEQKWTDEDRL